MTENSNTKRLVIGQQQWGIADADAEDVVKAVENAMLNGTAVKLPLLDGVTGHSVRVYLNGAATSGVEVDLLKGPRPSEMSK
ncbi:hypothetical protein [Jatrophihabitans sp.]|jgi:hypothetical protein|uniref:hypothetical protein n=1 Tax=Jatrophihabitans sp. TaxID=1932789 RepID=UPI002F1C74CF